MSNFTTNNKIAEIVEHDSNLLSVLNRFGIKLGFGDISVHQACINNNIDEDFFLAILNVYHNDNYFPEHKFANFKIIDIISYLIELLKITVLSFAQSINALDPIAVTEFGIDTVVKLPQRLNALYSI